MADDDFDTRLGRINQIADAVKKFDNPVLQEAAYHYLVGEGDGHKGPAKEAEPNPVVSTAPSFEDDVQDLDVKLDPTPAVKPAKKSPTKAAAKKQSFEIDKTINFYKADGGTKTPFNEFVKSHNPTNLLHKVTVAVYWLSYEALVPSVTMNHVYTAFKTIGWPIPNNLPNTVQQAGSKNYVNSKNSEALTETTHGENLVEHELEPAKK
ncbi:Uncharacterised protein [Mycobacteroides abscessus subsp. abscessus]|nr:Uncharacterised protein [Mycobacteroides abscessus subsp. abscessus]